MFAWQTEPFTLRVPCVDDATAAGVNGDVPGRVDGSNLARRGHSVLADQFGERGLDGLTA